MTADNKNPLCDFEDIYQQVFLPKFHENRSLQGEADFIFNSADPFLVHAPKIESILMVIYDLRETLEGGSAGEYLQIHTRDFYYLLSE